MNAKLEKLMGVAKESKDDAKESKNDADRQLAAANEGVAAANRQVELAYQALAAERASASAGAAGACWPLCAFSILRVALLLPSLLLLPLRVVAAPR